ncbi:hypothetical protein NGH46_13775 [Staphylococcus xylosus]|uniref:hypothetical protein n=1 Tax=Staphylococcus xylosus TaxID=1288 RepID=UPI002DB562D3|nr:hypothetical protein [Staphylococcus xylosus]MEB8123178.1 hypothetical protein [Staphylococcus xylosus]
MGKSNIDKYREIESMMNQFLILEQDFLDKLKERYDYMSTYRAEYNRLKRAVNSAKSDLEGKKASEISEDEKSALYGSIKSKLNKQIERYTEAIEYESSSRYKQAIVILKDALNTLRKDITKKRLERINDELISINVSVEEIEALISIISKENMEKKKLNNAISLLDAAYSEYLGTFSEYRLACENKDGIVETFEDIHRVLIGLGFESEAARLQNTLPDYDDQKRMRPNSDELLEILKPFKSNELVYWQSNNNNSHSYDYNIKLSESISKTRATLLRNAEYKGTERAFKELKNDYSDLKSYMEEKYYQLGGKPTNYHGHDGRKKK